MTEQAREPGGSRTALLDAAEQLMREQGYAAVTSRRVAAQAGLKPQLVHYYFKTMDDLFLAVFRRLAESIIARQDGVRADDRPLRQMWDILADSRYRLLIYEFVALGNHRKPIRAEFVAFGDALRKKQMRIMAEVLGRQPVSDFPWPPAFAAILLHSLARFLALEAELGVSEGHGEALRTVNRYIDRFDAAATATDARVAALEAEVAELRRRLAAAGA